MGSSQSWERQDSPAQLMGLSPSCDLCAVCPEGRGHSIHSLYLSLPDIYLSLPDLHNIPVLAFFLLLYSLLSFLSIQLFLHWVMTWYRFTRTRCNRSSVYHILSNKVHRVIKANKNRVPVRVLQAKSCPWRYSPWSCKVTELFLKQNLLSFVGPLQQSNWSACEVGIHLQNHSALDS